MSDGFVQALWRFPVLAMAGERLRSTQVDARGVAGDRQHYAAGPEGRLTGQDLPALAEWQATFPFNPDGAIIPDRPPPLPVLSGPGGVKSWRWGDPRLGFALERALGRPVELVRDIESAARRDRRHRAARSMPPEVAGINVQLSLELPPRRLGTAASSCSATACACDSSRHEPTARVSRLVWSKPDGWCSVSRSR